MLVNELGINPKSMHFVWVVRTSSSLASCRGYSSMTSAPNHSATLVTSFT